MDRQPARDLPDLRAFMQRRSPYIDYDDPAPKQIPAGSTRELELRNMLWGSSNTGSMVLRTVFEPTRVG